MEYILIEECCDILDSRRIPITASDRMSGPYPYYGANGVQDYVADYIFDDELVLLAEDGGNFGSKTRPIAYRVSGKCWVNNHAHVLKPMASMDVDYLCYSLMFYDTGELVNGATRQKLTQTAMRKMLIPQRSLQEQKRIVCELNKVQSIISARQQQLQKLDELVKARFIELFGDPELNPRGLPVLPWNAVFLTTTGKLDSNAMVENGRYPFFTCAKESYKIDSYAFDCEALLLAGNNAAGIYDVKHYKGKFNAYQRTYVLRLMNEKWSYILFKRQLEDKLQYLQSQSKGTNTRYLTLGILNELHFVVPPVAEQEQFAAFVEQTDKSKVAVQKALDEAQLLFDSLMQKYFG
jgi:type I restriction enzyme S subunit